MYNDLETLVAAVLQSSKYRTISLDLIRAVGLRELTVQRNLREAIKATKSRLHQVAGAYLERVPPYAAWLAALEQASGPNGREQLQAVCRPMLAAHASTRERLPELEQCYSAIFGLLPPITSLLDLACGLNPLAAPWMPLPADARYDACDLYSDMGDFLNAALPLLGLQGMVTVCDLTTHMPDQAVDLALVLKTLPVLEQARRGAGRDLLRGLRARHLVVSFPTRSLGGRNVGMAATYGAQFRAIADAEGWPYQELRFTNELVFVAEK